jgi:hypothetical protein
MINFIGFLLPALIDLINRKVSDSDARFWVSVLVCSLTGIGVELLQSGFVFITADPFIEEIMIMFGIAQLVYKGIYEDSKIQKAIRGTSTSTSVEIELPKIN